jgi:hypothetical protein
MTALRKYQIPDVTPAVGGVPAVGQMAGVPGYDPRTAGGFYPLSLYRQFVAFVDGEGVTQKYPAGFADYKLNAELFVHAPPISDEEKTRLIEHNLRGWVDFSLPYVYCINRLNWWTPGVLEYPDPQPEQFDDNLRNEWDAGAITTEGFADRAAFSFAGDEATYAVVGLREAGANVDDPHAIAFGFFLKQGQPISVLESGVAQSLSGSQVSTPANTLTVRYVDGVVDYLVNGVSKRSVTVAPTSPTIWYGGATLYSKTANITAAAMNGVSKGAIVFQRMRTTSTSNAAMTFPRMTVSGGHAFPVSVLTFPRMRVMANSGGWNGVVFPVMKVRGGNYATYADGAVTLPRMTAGGYSGRPLPVGAMLTFARTRAIGVGTTGGTGSAALTLPKMRVGANVVSGVAATFPRMRVFGFDEASNEAFISAAPLARDPMEAASVLVLQIDSAGAVAAVAAVQLVRDGSLVGAIGLDDAVSAARILTAEIQAQVLGLSFEPLNEQGGETWVVNADTGASTSYENFVFNSYATIDGVLHGVRSDGLYVLQGATDDGDPIRASLNFGDLNFGTMRKKRFENVFVGVSGSGTMYLKVTADGVSYTYEARKYGDGLSTARFTLGRGLRANFATFELFNGAGADFDLESVQFHAVELDRSV